MVVNASTFLLICFIYFASLFSSAHLQYVWPLRTSQISIILIQLFSMHISFTHGTHLPAFLKVCFYLYMSRHPTFVSAKFRLIRFFCEKRLAQPRASRFHLCKDTGGALSSMPHYFLNVISFRLMAQRLYWGEEAPVGTQSRSSFPGRGASFGCRHRRCRTSYGNRKWRAPYHRVCGN